MRNIFFQFRFRKQLADLPVALCVCGTLFGHNASELLAEMCKTSWGRVGPAMRFSHEHVWKMSFHLPRCLFVCFVQFGVFLPLWGSFQKPTSLTRLTQGKMGQTATKAPVCPLPTAKLAQRPSRKRKKPKMLAALPNKACPGAPAQPRCGQNDLDRCPANCGMLSYLG